MAILEVNELKCLECDDYARWHVWYKGFGNVYSSFCDVHLIDGIMVSRAGYVVVCIKLVADQFLPDGDRAKGGT